VAEELEADLSCHHERAGELPAVRVDGDGQDGDDLAIAGELLGTSCEH
jgi:hypothetical protein